MNTAHPSVRLGIVGLGNVGRYHAAYIYSGKVPRVTLAGVCTSNAEKAAAFPGVPRFSAPGEMFNSGSVDAVLVATPHFEHTLLGIQALQAGLHLIVEKPISAHKADAERLLAVANAHSDLVFAAMFQLRVEPRYLAIRDLLRSRVLGQIQRFTWIMTDWFRTDAYYASSAWRATWAGEGGGLLLNQCLHNLDMLQWLLGMPEKVRGFCQFGHYHRIEVEDQVSAYLEYSNGASAVFISSTGEAPGTNRLEIAGSLGRLVMENDKLVLTRNVVDSREFCRSSQSGFSKPDCTTEEIPFNNVANPHALLLQNFADAILDNTPLTAPGTEGIASVELANAILHSSLQGQTISLPLNASAWEAELNRLIAQSTHCKHVATTTAVDFSSSFRK